MPVNDTRNASDKGSVLNSLVEKGLTVLDASGNPLSFDKIVINNSIASGTNTLVTTVATVDALRSLEPTAAGELAVVMEYATGLKSGGGIFIYDITDKKTPEDYGINIVTPKGARWTRYLTALNDVNVLYFGAVHGGETDCAEAVKRMWAWSQKYSPNIGIQFPAGKFLVSKFDIAEKEVGRFRLAGELVTFGYSPATTLVSDKKSDEVMFNVQARYTEITSLIVDGQSSSDSPNTKGFYKNIVETGQFIRISNIMFYNMGGRSVSMLDTLDCKIDQWYARGCTDTVIYGTWSDNPKGKWDHITAVELSNFNIQRSTGKPAIDLQRATQSFIWNGWIEHSEFPGNISNGSWSIQGLNIESSENPLECHYTRLINTQFNQQGAGGLDFSETGDTWDLISKYEKGDVHIENHGIEIAGSVSWDYLTSPDKMDNPADSEKWFYAGELIPSQIAVQTKIKILGSSGYSSQSSTQTGFSARTPEGYADIYLQRSQSGFVGSWTASGSCPVTRVLTQPGSSTGKIKLYLKLAQYARYCTAIVETNDFSRFSKGIRFIFNKSYTAASAEETAVLDAAPDNCFLQQWSGRAAVGFGYNNDNELLLRGKTLPVAEFSDATRCLKILIDGQPYGLELKPLRN